MKVICSHAWMCGLGTSTEMPVLSRNEYDKANILGIYSWCEGRSPKIVANSVSHGCGWVARVGLDTRPVIEEIV